jgi:hypothetical protein
MPCFLVPLHESNDCHAPAGSPAGGQFCSGFLRGEAARAGTLGVTFTVDPALRTRDSGFYPKDRRVEIGLNPDEWALTKAGQLSVARHELGHVTDPMYGSTRAQRIIGGDKVGKLYAEEFGAWRAAIRDSGGRVQWRTVRQALTNYLYDDFAYTAKVKDRLMHQGVASGPTSEDWDNFSARVSREIDHTLDRHVGLLRRYARRVRAARR